MTKATEEKTVRIKVLKPFHTGGFKKFPRVDYKPDQEVDAPEAVAKNAIAKGFAKAADGK